MSSFARGLRLGLALAVTIITPVALIITSIRVIFTDAALQFEYRAPGFPPDPYGFTVEDRIHWAKLSKDYLFNNADISFLENQRLPDGSPLYNPRELTHMVDVKNLFQVMVRVWWVLLGVLAVLGLIAWRQKWGADYRRGLSRGGWLTVGLVIAVLLGVAASFNWLFTEFHRIFFEGDTWIFRYSDTLIRLFPIRLWQDVFIFAGLFNLAAGVALGYFLRERSGRKAAVRQLR